jgi:hypothetical protein
LSNILIKKMPTHKVMRHKVSKRRKMRGRGVLSWLKTAGNFIKKNKVLSRIGAAIEPHSGSFAPYVRAGTSIAKTLGLGMGRKLGMGKKRRVGHGFRLAGTRGNGMCGSGIRRRVVGGRIY